MDGGIATYGKKYKDDGLWEGKLYVFGGRLVSQFSKKAQDIGHCVHCDTETSNFENCAHLPCNYLVLICKNCTQNTTICSQARETLKAAV